MAVIGLLACSLLAAPPLALGSAGEGFLASRPEVPQQCRFAQPPDTNFYWEPECTLEMPGCWADSANLQCRFCGSAPYVGIECGGGRAPAENADAAQPAGANRTEAVPAAGSTQEGGRAENTSWAAALSVNSTAGERPSPSDAVAELPVPAAAEGNASASHLADEEGMPSATASDLQALTGACKFSNKPTTPYFWDPTCRNGKLGCLADGKHEQCRFCGTGAYVNIPCPWSCTFANPPRTRYYWDPNCTLGTPGCLADGVHVQCRFCSRRPFTLVNCPVATPDAPRRPQQGACDFPGGRPAQRHFWDPSCTFGMLGCWADGVNPECRWCGFGAYQSVACPP